MSEGTFFFEADGRHYHPTPATRGPWDPSSMHGRVVIGLMGHHVEREHGEPNFQPARLTADLFRVPPMQPLTITTDVIRDGNRIKVVDASMTTEDGTEFARGTVVFLRHADQPEGEVWSPPAWDVPPPEDVAPQPPPDNAGDTWVPIWETRRITGDFGMVGRKQVWVRETHDLLEGMTPTPFVRAALIADLTNPYANSGSAGLNFVNADATMYLHRNPVGEWIGLDVAAHHSSRGVAIGECVLYDRDGAFGRSSVCCVANRHRK